MTRAAALLADMQQAAQAAMLGVLARALGEDVLPEETKAAGAVKTPRRAGGKRNRAQIEATAEACYGVIVASPGMITEAIATKLGVTSADVSLPLRRLVDAGRVTRAGTRRFARFTAAQPPRQP